MPDPGALIGIFPQSDNVGAGLLRHAFSGTIAGKIEALF
jgi:hypothetical protein